MPQQANYRKTILCLANSRKMAGRCFAGKEIEDGRTSSWIRPVSAREHEEISDVECRYTSGRSAALLDIISIPMLRAKPNGHQVENHLIADRFFWRRVAQASWTQIVSALDPPQKTLWMNGYSTAGGANDRIPEEAARALKGSLLLLQPDKLEIHLGPVDESPVVKRKARALFSLNGSSYNLGVTDDVWERRHGEGTYPLSDALLCISLGEPFNGFVYKLAAAIITRDRVDGNDG